MNIRKIIQEEFKKFFLENYPMGAEYLSDAPWNKVDNTKIGERAKQIKYKLIWTDKSEFAFLKDEAENIFVFYIDGVDKSEFEPYANIEKKYLGKDEDGMPDIEYGDFEITEDVIENYINDNLDSLRIGKGLDDYDSAEYELVMLDDELRSDLSKIAPYIKDKNNRNGFLNALGSQISESRVVNNVVNKKNIDTPIETIFKIDIESGE